MKNTGVTKRKKRSKALTAPSFRIFKVVTTTLILIFLISVNLSGVSAAQPPQNGAQPPQSPANGTSGANETNGAGKEVLLHKIQRVISQMADDLNKPTKNWQASLTGFIKNFLPSAGPAPFAGYEYVVNAESKALAVSQSPQSGAQPPQKPANPLARFGAGLASGTRPPVLWDYSNNDFKNLLQFSKNALALVNQDFGILAYVGTNVGNERGLATPDSDSEVLPLNIQSVPTIPNITKQVIAAAKRGAASIVPSLSRGLVALLPDSLSFTAPAPQVESKAEPRFTRPAITTDKEVINQVLRSSKSVLAPFTQDFLEPRERVVFPPAGGPPTGGQPLVSQNLKNLIKELARKITDIDISKLFSPKELGDIQQELTELQKKEVIDESTLDTLTERISERLPKTPQTTSPSVSSGQTPQTQTIKETRVVEKETKIIETQVVTNEAKINELTALLDQLKKQQAKDRQDLFNAIALTNRINTIPSNTTINNVTITNPSFANEAITDAMVIDTITASNYLPLGGGTVTGSLTVDGAVTFGTISSIANVLGNFGIGGDLSVNGGDIQLGTGSATTTITSSSGNLGIGTTSPYRLLSVAGQAAITSTTTIYTDLVVGTSSLSGPDAVFGAPTFDLYPSGVNATANRLVPRFKSPYGDIWFILDAAANQTNLLVFNSGGSRKWQVGKESDDDFVFWDSASGLFNNDVLMLKKDGRVGISSSTPWGMLSVERAQASSSAPIFVVSEQGTSSPYFIVKDTGFIGIGTSSPSQLLSVHGNALISGNLTLANLTATGTLNLSGLSTFVNATASQLTVTGNTYLAANSGSVGIGTTSPSKLLSVHGGALIAGTTTVADLVATGTLDVRGAGTSTLQNNLRVLGTLQIGSGSTYISSTELNSTGTFTIKTQSQDNHLVLQTLGRVGVASTTPWGVFSVERNGANSAMPILVVAEQGTSSPYFIVNDLGNVGIGTTTPRSLFAVHGSALISGNLNVANLTATGTLNLSGLSTFTNATSSLLTVTGSTYLATGSGSVGIGTTTPGALLAVQGRIITEEDLYTGNLTATGTALLATKEGSVGISTTTPSQLLSVQGNALISGTTTVGALNATGTVLLATNAGNNVGIGTTSPYVKLSVAGILAADSLNVNLQTATSTFSTGLTVGNNSAFVVNRGATANSLYVAENGNVGINIASPATRLSILENAGDGNGTPAMGIGFQNDTTFTRAGIYSMGSANYGGILHFATNPGGNDHTVTSKMTILANGNVGIGTTNPQQILHAVGSQILTGDLFLYGADINLGTGSATTTITSASGNLGIATTTPSQLLSVQGNALIAGTTTVRSLIATNTLMVGGNSGTSFVVKSDGTGYFGGNVGIGTTTPGALLAVQGGIISGGYLNIGNLTATGTLTLSGSTLFDFRNAGTSTLAQVSNAFSIATSTTARPILSLDGKDGNVGIGTASSTQRLTVAGSIENILPSNASQYRINPKLIGSAAGGGSTGLDAGIYIVGRYAYVANYGEGAFKIYDISTSSPALVSSVSSNLARAVYVSGQYAYVSRWNNNIEIYDITAPAKPSLTGVVNPNTGLGKAPLYVSGRYLYIADYQDIDSAFRIFDVSNPALPVPKGVVRTGNAYPMSIKVVGHRAFVLNNNGGITVVNVANPSAPIVIGSVSDAGNGGLYVLGNYAYSTNNGTLFIHSIASSTPSLVSSIGTDGVGQSVFAAGRYVYVVINNTNALQVFDVVDPKSPVLVGRATTDSTPQSVFVSGRYAYVANDSETTNTLQVFDISGIETTSAIVHSLEAGNLQVRNDIIAQGQLSVGGGVGVGAGGILSSGPLAVSATTSLSSILGGLTIGTTTPATSSPNFIAITSSVVTIEATSTGAIPLTIRGAGTQAVNYFQIQNSANLNQLVLSSSGQLGIGTTTPSQLLSVQGNALISGTTTVGALNATGTVLLATNAGNNVGIGTSTPTAQLTIANGPSGVKISGDGTNANITALGTVGRLWFGNEALATTAFIDNSGLGFNGTSGSPLLPRTAAVSSPAYQFQDDGNTGMYWLSANTMGLATDGTNALTINGSQNVGLSQTSPAYKLDVTGNGRFTTFVDAANFVATSTSVASTFAYNVGIGTTTPSQLLSVQGNALISGTTTVGALNATGTVLLATNAGNNVGIGTTSPTSRIHADATLSAATGDEAAYTLYYTTNKSTSGNDTGLVINQADIASPGTSLLMDLQVGGVSRLKINNATTPTMTSGGGLTISATGNFTVSATTGTILNNTAKIGLSTPSVVADLVVMGAVDFAAGDARLAIQGESGDYLLLGNNTIIGGTGTASDLTLQTTSGVGAAGADMHFLVGNNGATEAMTILNDGKVGIGSVNPLQALHAVGSQILTGDLDIYGGDINLGTGSATTTITSASGNLGIGTTTPSQLLSVQGNALISGTTTVRGLVATSGISIGAPNTAIGANLTIRSNASYLINVVSLTDGNLFRLDSGGAGNFGGAVTAAGFTSNGNIVLNATSNLLLDGGGDTYLTETSANNIDIYTGGSQAVRIDSSQRVGISTTTPSQLLSVQGNAIISGTTTLAGFTATGTSYIYNGGGVQADLRVLNGSVCADNNGGTKCTTNVVAGTVYGDTGTFAASDLAENYPISDDSIEEGDIVALSSAVSFTQQSEKARFEADSQIKDKNQEDNQALAELLKTALIKATQETQNKIIGAISTNPGVLLGDVTGMTLNTKTKPVALSGRIPVKVNLENGPIQVGDPITISSVPGVGKKAVQSGKIVGYALENYNGPTTENNGKVLVFTSLGYWIGPDLPNQQLTTNNQQLITNNQQPTTNNHNLVALIIDTIKSWLGSLKVFVEDGLVRLKNLIAERITTDELELKDKITGEIYCVSVVSGQLTQVLGSCDTHAAGSASLTTSGAPSIDTGTTTLPMVSDVEPLVVSDVEPPVIILNGPGAIDIEIGVSWSDPGATVTDNVNDNLGVHYQLDGVETSSGGTQPPQIDTSIAANHIITYTAIDAAGNTGTAERTVNVISPTITVTTTATTTDATVTDAGTQ